MFSTCYSRKMRCQDCDDCNVVPTPILYKGTTSSSLYFNIKNSKHVYNSEESQNSITEKGQGNTKKRGSGGNSYAAYLAKKQGKIYCDCNIAK